MAGVDVWAGVSAANSSRAGLAAPPTTTITLDASKTFAGLRVPDYRFQIANATPVTYFCNPAAGVGQLRRYSGYPLQAAQPVNAAAAPLSVAQNNLLATQITACNAQLVPGNRRRAQVVALTLVLAAGNPPDSLRLYQAIRVESLP